MITVSEACLIPLGEVVVKARTDSSGKRTVEVEASSEEVDSQGDIVLQRSLLDSADSFVRSGHLDIDHLSEIGSRLGIKNPDSYIVGRPVEVTDLGKKRTGVVGEIMKSLDGAFDPDINRFDSFWKSLQSDPPVKWAASIYGFPTDIEDCTDKSCSSGATRYVIKAIDWRSLAFTRNPVNQSLRGYAKVVTAKAMIEAMQKDMLANPFGLSEGPVTMPVMMACPTTLDHAWGQYQRHGRECQFMKTGNSVKAFKDHFVQCCGAQPDQADILAHALMYSVLRSRRRA
jgi:hypothetical protein